MEDRIGRRAMIGNLVGTLVALPAGLFLVNCSSSGSTYGGYGAPGGAEPAAAPVKSGNQIVYTSDTVEAHSHTFGIDAGDFATPPSGGDGGETSISAGHAHSLSISMAELQNVEAGDSVQVTTTSVSGHTHVFTFVKVA